MTDNSPKGMNTMPLAILLTLAAAAYRLAPHPWNIAPLGAIALLGGMQMGRRYALWLPILALVLTDLILNVRMGYSMLYWPRAFDYGAFALIGALGLWSRTRQPWVKLSAVAATPFAFYLLSNLGVWMFGLSLTNEPYSKTFAGLVTCYAAGLPFLRGTIIGDWGFMAAFALTAQLAQLSDLPQLRWLAAETKA
jgi:hypothetical protein